MQPTRLTRIWQATQRLLLLLIGTLISALAFSVFQEPYDLAAGGVSGIGLIVAHFTGWSVSIFYFVTNLPLLVLGFFYLGRWRFLVKTVVAVFIFSAAVALFDAYLPSYTERWPLTDNVLLSAIYAGLVGGIGGGLIYAAGATLGGTGIIGRVLQRQTGMPISQLYLFVDGGIIVAAALVFGWKIALYAMLTLLLGGIATDYVLEGPSRSRTAFIITNKPHALIQAFDQQLGRGASYWEATGGYKGEHRTVVMCAIYRPQVNELKAIVAQIDPGAFVSIGMTQQVLGAGFTKMSG
ncbi:MAG: YitT family protein [Caldilineaceae bacterium]